MEPVRAAWRCGNCDERHAHQGFRAWRWRFLQNYFKDVVAATTADTSKVQKRYSELENSPEGLRIQEELAAVRKSYLETRDKSLALKKASDMAQAKSYALGTFAPVLTQYNAVADKTAVEAARAGEQGRGFAVVASEVRNLAQRSAEAAKEIKTLIGASAEKVDAGTHLVGNAGQSMEDIVTQVQRVSDLIGEISSATGEQTIGISQVGEAVTQLDQVTQQNAALVEQSAAAADSLKHQAAKLAQIVSVFRLGS